MISEKEKQSILNLLEENKQVRLSTVCKYLEISARTIQRWKKDGLKDNRKGAEKSVPKKLSKEEELAIYSLCCSNEYKEMNPREVFNSLLDKGLYYASESTFYRILKKYNALAHRSESKKGTSRNKSQELKAYRKNQVWMWDITWLKSPVTGIWYYAYVIEDLYDRSIVAWMIFENESDGHSRELFDYACRKENAHPDFVHSDNGNPMKGVTLVALYYQLGIVPSFSRPRVSDDNPFIESFFKTLKYKCGYPHHFENIEHARKWFADFIHWYNFEHKHSGLQFITPMQKRQGKHFRLFANRNEVIRKAREKNPLRWSSDKLHQYKTSEFEILNPEEKSA